MFSADYAAILLLFMQNLRKR